MKEHWIADLGDGTYENPILYTDYSDPDAIRVGDDYFMIASSFCNSPAIPLLHSKDLVSWVVVNYVLQQIPETRYEKPVHGCGVWAPSIRYHEGTYYVCFPMPDEGIYMTTTKNPFGKWSEPINIRPGAGWIDPCPFWDEDGRAYLVAGVAKSRIGYKSVLHLVEMNPEGTRVFGEKIRIFDGNENDQVTIEGPKLYKKDDFYYIFAPAGGVKNGWQTVLRSKNIRGPYEYKVVMRQGNTGINGPHQGAWIQTQTGEDWFIHFQDVYAAGRIIHLQPMHWDDGWPIIGVNQPGKDYGEPVSRYRKPNVGASYKAFGCETSDDFDGSELGLQWQWNANYKRKWYDLLSKQSKIRLYSQQKDQETALVDLPNLLLQKWPADEFYYDSKLDLSELAMNDVAGVISIGKAYGALLIRKREDKMQLIQITGKQEFKHGYEATDEEKILATWSTNDIYIRYKVEHTGIEPAKETPFAPVIEATFLYGEDGVHYEEAFRMVAKEGRWVGVKSGFVCYHEDFKTKAGALLVDYIRYCMK